MPTSGMRRSRARRRPSRSARGPALPEDSRSIDARYGLEPVFEPGTAAQDADRGGTRFQVVQCPYCGEPFETLLDLSAGSADYVEDCQVCCQPIEFTVEVDAAGRLARLRLARGD